MWQKKEKLGRISAVAVWPCLREREQLRHEAEELARKKKLVPQWLCVHMWCVLGKSSKSKQGSDEKVTME